MKPITNEPQNRLFGQSPLRERGGVRAAAHMTKPRFSPMRKQCLPSECRVDNLAVDVDSNLGEQLPEPLMATSYYTMERLEECRRADSLSAMYACSTSARTSLFGP